MTSSTPTRLTSSLARAAVGAATIALGEIHDNVSPTEFESGQDTASVQILAENIDERAASDFTCQIEVSISEPTRAYGFKEETRFDELVVLRATGSATEEQQKEFLELQAAQRAASQNNSSAAIMAEFRRRQALIDALKFLNRYASLLQPKDQKKLRTIL